MTRKLATPLRRRLFVRRSAATLLVAVLSTVGLGVVAPGTGADAATSTGPVTVDKTVQRTFTDATDKTTSVDKRDVKVTVAQTTGLRSLQLTKVTWSGAHPTGGTVSDVNSDLAQNEEYSMALFECRGTDTPEKPLDPSTCWTQYGDERFSYGYDDPPYPAWRSDALAPASERAAYVNRPTGSAFTSACANDLFGDTFERWVPFVGADKTVYPGGVFGCAGQPAEASPANTSGNLSLPSNETYGVTDSKGNGSADFDIFTAEDHASLGCSATVPCSLVAVPIMGISCDPYGLRLPTDSRPSASDAQVAAQNCEGTGNYKPGQILPSGSSGDPAVDGSLWWSASNWSNRITVPLTFAPADNVCSLQGSSNPVDIYGSEVLTQATTSWAPYFCLNSKLFDLNHVQTPEPQARNLLAQGNVEAAYTSEPPDTPYPLPTVNAPVAVSGFGIAATVDDATGQQVDSLRLDARLLAKLLTESYTAILAVKQQDPALANNPFNITDDPEFQALNPNVPKSAALAAATLLTVNTDSDVMYALTQYINADPVARAWLDGTPDPWGMVVNPNYKKISLPVSNWPLLDTLVLKNQATSNPCLDVNPVPYLPLVAAPTARLFSIAQDMQFALAQNQTTCVLPSPIPLDTTGAKLVAQGRQAAGFHFMLGVVSLGDAARSGLTLSSLQTQSDVSASTAITDATGQTFVAPTTAGLKAAAATLQPDTSTGTWTLPYSALRTTKVGADAYPGTMVVYAAIPTKGLPSGDGPRYAQFLQFAAARGQVQGIAQGDLPAGYLPLTSANGLGTLAAYTARAATAVGQQKGALPSLTSAGSTGGSTKTGSSNSSGSGSSGRSSSGSSSGGANGTSAGSSNGGSGSGAAPAGTTGSGSAPTSAPSSVPSSSAGSAPGSVAATPVALKTPSFGSTAAGVIPILLGAAIVLMIAALVVRLRVNGRQGL